MGITKIVIVDDSKQMKEMVEKNFYDNKKYEIREVNDGQKAYEQIKSFEPDVVVLDLILPNKDGYSVLSSLKSLENMPKIIICSALTNPNFVHKALEMGADYFLGKPCSFEDLEKAICEQFDENVNQTKITKIVDSFKPKKVYSSMDEKISNIFITVGIPAHIKGYQFLREAIKMTINSPDIINSITKKLYPNIATMFSTSPSKVERAIRHAIEVAWNRGKIENINSVFGLPVYGSNDKPTNGEFIALVADKMLVEGA
ncbi:MAG: sporulation transcription factor Spo0A [Clostridia bacterium]|nr:sporulation transcription factor Spo0A [Clostridia bacterium]